MNIKEILIKIAVQPSSFYAVISGAFIGAATNLFTVLISIQCGGIKKFILLAAVLLIVSSGFFLYVYKTLEPLQYTYRGSDLRKKIKERQIFLPSFLVGCACFIMSIVILTCTLYKIW
jgi:high-affinity Fe2+/Pb2+ permease